MQHKSGSVHKNIPEKINNKNGDNTRSYAELSTAETTAHYFMSAMRGSIKSLGIQRDKT